MDNNNNVTLRELLEAGCHFGHHVTKLYPRARDFIFAERDGISIIDLAKTREGLVKAMDYVNELGKNNGKIIFVGTKRQAKEIVKEAAIKCGAYYITERWPAGLLTNWEVIKKNLQEIKNLQEAVSDPEKQKGYTKREIGLWKRRLDKMMIEYEGIKNMEAMPDAVFIVDMKAEEGVVREASRSHKTVVAMVDTNSNPDNADYAIPTNDDAVGAISFIVNKIAEAYAEGLKTQEKVVEKPEEKIEKPVEKKVKTKKVNSKSKITNSK